MVPTNISYDSVLDRHGGGGNIPDPTHLDTISRDLKMLAQLATARGDANTKGMRDLSDRRKQILEEEREREREQARIQAEEERKNLKREAEDDEVERESKAGKQKKKKEQSVPREERPLNHGAHGLARQDGLDLPLEGMSKCSLIQLVKHSCINSSQYDYMFLFFFVFAVLVSRHMF